MMTSLLPVQESRILTFELSKVKRLNENWVQRQDFREPAVCVEEGFSTCNPGKHRTIFAIPVEYLLAVSPDVRYKEKFMRILNADQLVSHGNTKLRQHVLQILETGLTAADPYWNAAKLI